MTHPTPAPQAGPELDAAVWTLLGYPMPISGDSGVSLPFAAGSPWKWIAVGPDEFACDPISTDPGAAFRALMLAVGDRDHPGLLKRRHPDAWWKLECSKYTANGMYECEISLDGQDAEIVECAETLPLAAALALRAALGRQGMNGQFRCHTCGGVFDRADEAAAAEERRRLFGGPPEPDDAVVCDDCFRRLVPVGGAPTA